MKVLHLLKTSVGASWALRQVRELVRRGVEVHVALPPDGSLIPQYIDAGVVVHTDQFSLPVRSPGRWPAMFERFRRLVTAVQPDLIHSHFVGTTLTMRLALGRNHSIPRIFQVPGPLHLEHTFYRWAELQTSGPADYWVGSCRWTCDRYRASGIDQSRVFLSYYGIDIDQFKPSAPGMLRRELGLSPEAKIAGMVAYMYGPKFHLGQKRGLKGHEDFIDALALCLQSRSELVGIVVGGAWGDALEYERRVRAYGTRRLGERIHFLGTRSDVPNLYADMDVVVHPSHSENVGGAAESLMLGVPTIATNVGGFPDLIEPGRTGWLVPPRDPPRLSSAILDALGDPPRAKAMAAEGQARACRVLDVRENAREITVVYRQILAEAGNDPPAILGSQPHDRSTHDHGRSGGRVKTSSALSEGVARHRHAFSQRKADALSLAAKRLVDIAGSLIGLCVFGPVMALIALTLLFVQGAPVVFSQIRPGYRARPFRLYKFRTMREAFDEGGEPLSDAARLTSIGRFLRRTSLDELPQLWNVLRGDLSLVGPRPLLMDYLPLYSAVQSRRHEVKPGMTGWAQVNGRNALAWEDKFRLDVWYVDHRSLRLDLTILAMTIRKVAVGDGVSSDPQVATAHPFRGSSTGEVA